MRRGLKGVIAEVRGMGCLMHLVRCHRNLTAEPGIIHERTAG